MASATLIRSTTARAARARGCLAVLALGLGLSAALAAFGAGASATPPPRAPAPAVTITDCQNLLRQFDVAWPAHRQSTQAASAWHSRELGDGDCRAGRYADGVHHLRRALHDIGVKPVKSVGPAPR